MRRITKTIIWIGVGGVLYLVASNHFIYFGGSTIKLLKKKQLTFSRTFFSTSLKTRISSTIVKTLPDKTPGGLLIRMGRMSKEEEVRFLKKLEKYD